jgi:hypothetical protein
VACPTRSSIPSRPVSPSAEPRTRTAEPGETTP